MCPEREKRPKLERLIVYFQSLNGLIGSGGRDINLAPEPFDFLRIFATDRGDDSACAIIGATKWSPVQQNANLALFQKRSAFRPNFPNRGT